MNIFYSMTLFLKLWHTLVSKLFALRMMRGRHKSPCV